MAIPRGTARLILDEARRRPFKGSALELGKMVCFFTRHELERWAQAHGVELARGVDVELSHDPRAAAEGCIDDRSLFRLLGFESVTSMDVSSWEGADLIADLNQPVPEDLRGRFDLVFESGTIQHVFHLPQVFENIFELLAVGGRVIHGMAPSHNHVDHGFHQFSPTLFADFYAANHFEIEAFYLFEYVPFWIRGRLESSPIKVRPYEPGSLDHLSYGRMGNRQMGLFAVATKTASSTGHTIPQQGFYRQFWKEQQSDEMAGGPPRPISPFLRRFDPLLRRWKWARELVCRFAPKKLPPVVARY